MADEYDKKQNLGILAIVAIVGIVALVVLLGQKSAVMSLGAEKELIGQAMEGEVEELTDEEGNVVGQGGFESGGFIESLTAGKKTIDTPPNLVLPETNSDNLQVPKRYYSSSSPGTISMVNLYINSVTETDTHFIYEFCIVATSADSSPKNPHKYDIKLSEIGGFSFNKKFKNVEAKTESAKYNKDKVKLTGKSVTAKFQVYTGKDGFCINSTRKKDSGVDPYLYLEVITELKSKKVTQTATNSKGKSTKKSITKKLWKGFDVYAGEDVACYASKSSEDDSGDEGVYKCVINHINVPLPDSSNDLGTPQDADILQ